MSTPRGGPRKEDCASPVEFAREVLGVALWSKQEEVLEALRVHRRVAVKSGNGLGKGFSAAVAILWFLCCHDPAVVLSTAPTFRQVRHVLWREVHRLYHRARVSLGGKLLDTRLEMPSLTAPDRSKARGESAPVTPAKGSKSTASADGGERFALGLSADGGDQFQGFHSPNMLIVVDEAEGVSEEIYEAIEGVLTSANCKLLLIGNPTTVTGAFRRAFYQDRELYHPITISALESPNVVSDGEANGEANGEQGDLIIPGLATKRWVEERKRVWGEENPIYQARVLGEFPDQAEDTLVPLWAVERAASAPIPVPSSTPHGTDVTLPSAEEQDYPVVLAVDVARFGSDKSVIALRRGMAVVDVRAFYGLDTMKLVGYVVDAINTAMLPSHASSHQPLESRQPRGGTGTGNRPRREDAPEVVIDEIGIGAGVVDRLREQGYEVQGINVGRPAQDSRHYANLRAEGYWNLRQLFLEGNIRIPQDNEMVGQLAAIRYSFNSQGLVVIEGKEDMRRRGVPSPDKADALMLAFLPNKKRRVRFWG